jgi:hypothetical protein
MKKLLVLIFGFISFCALAQNINQELNKLRIENESAYNSSEFVLINKKIPFSSRDATLQQLSDTTKPNKQEKIELEKLATFRKRGVEKDDQVFLKYITPPDYLSQLMDLRKNTGNVSISLLADLYGGKITFGEYNRKRKEMNDEFAAKNRELSNRFRSEQAQNLQPPPSSGKVIGQSFDNQANGNIFLYDGPCTIDNYRSSYPLRWDAKNASSGAHMGEGCYSLNQQTQQVFLIGPNGKPMSLPLANFQGGGNKSFFQSFSEGLQRATTYWNNSAAETQRNTTNLTPGLTGGNSMNCTPDGRGGYFCK